MSTVVAIVKSIVGQVIAVSPEGIRRVLIEGDRLYAGEQVLTGVGGAVTLQLADGRYLDLGRDSQWSAGTPDSSADMGMATAQAAPSVEQLQQAIQAGADPTMALEATAAGPSTSGGSSGALGGGHSFVMLEETAGRVDPTIGYQTGPLNFSEGLRFEQFAGLDTTVAADTGTAVTLSATPSISENGGTIVYVATVGQAPLSELTVTLSNGAVIVIAAGQTSGSVNIAVPANDTVYVDGRVLSVNITGTSGGGLPVNIDNTPASTRVVDSIDTTTATLSASPVVAEGGAITYTVTLSNPAQTAVTVSLSNGQVINIAAGQSSGSVSLQAANDVYQGASTLSTSITSASGGNFEHLEANPAPVLTVINDSVDTTTVTLTASTSASENGNILYTASLSAPVTGTPVVVTLANGQAITVAVGQSVGTVSVPVGNDVYQGQGQVSNSISTVSGGNFENLVANPTPVSTTISAVQDTTTVSLSATPSVAEGGQILYTATLSNPAQSAVTVTLSNGQTITIAANQASGSISVAAPGDDRYVDGGLVSARIIDASGGNFEQLAINSTPALTTVTDTLDTSTVMLSATPSVAEGGTILYTATVNAPVTGSPLLVSLANGQIITIAVGQSAGTAMGTASNDVYQGHAPVTNSIVGVSGGNYENLVANPAPVSTNVTDVLDSVRATLSATASVAEGGSIVYTVTLDAPVAGAPVVVTLSNGQTISIAVGQSVGTATATVSNEPYQGHAAISNSIAGISGGNFENLVADQASVSTRVTNVPDSIALTLTATPAVAEGGTIVYTVTVNAPVTGAPLVVSLANGQTVTIPVGQSSGTVAAVVDNDAYQGHAPIGNSITGVSGGNYENLVADQTPVSTTVTDVQDTTTVSLTATPSVLEGGTIVYTASVGAPVTGSPVVVTLTNGQTITIPVGQSSGTATGAVSNDVYQGHAPVTNSISDVSGGNYENLIADKTQVSTNVTDVQDTTTVTLTATPSVAEGGTIVYTATVNAPVSGSAVVVTLANGQIITIPVGQSTGTATSAVSNDVYQGHAPVTNTITAVSGGNYESLVANAATVSTTITDVQDTTTVTLTATPSVSEGGTILYTATVGAPVTGNPVVVTLTNGQIITIAVGQSSGTATGVVSNDVYQGHAPVTNSISSVTGGSYENLVADKSQVSTSVTDVTDTTTVTLTATPSVAEGGTILYTATVDAPVTGSPVVVTLNNGQTITIPVGQSYGTATGAVSNDVYQGHAAVSNSITSVSGGNYENLVADQAPVSTSVTDVQDTTTVSLSATPSVAEGGQIVYTATLTNAAQSPVTVTLSNGQTITIGANQTSGSVSVATHGDNPYLDAGQVSARITNATGGNFENLAVNSTPAVTNVTDTVDTSTVSLTATPSVAEGGTIVYTATVTAPVTGSAVVVTLANGQTITIPVGQSSGTATAAVSNDVYQGHPAVSNSISNVSGGNYENLVADKTQVSTSVTDVTDTTTVTLTASPSVAEGGTILYTASVGAPVTGSPVVVTLTNGQSITIPVGQSTGTATSAVSNDVYQGHAPVTNSISDVSGGSYENLVADKSQVSTTVTDVTDTTTVTLTATPSVAEGGTIIYTASVGAPVTGSPVVVSLANGQSITIPVGQSSGTATGAVTNDVYQGHAAVSNSITSVSGGNFENLVADQAPVSTSVTDVQDTTTVSLSATPSVAEGGQIVYTATLTNAAQSPVTVTLSNGQTITIGANQTSGSISVATHGDNPYLDAGQVSASITNASGGNFENLAVNSTPAVTNVTDTVDTSTVSLTATPSVAEGGTIIYTATVTAPVTGSAVVVTLANGQTITIPVGQSSGTATAAVSNDVYQGHPAVANSISNVSGGNYENLVADKTTVSTSVTDVTDTTTVTLTATPSVAEGGSIIYTASVNAPVTGSPVVVSLANGQTITIAVGQSSGTTTGMVSNDVYQGQAPVTNNITAVSGGNYENLIANTATVSTTVTDVQDTTTVTLTATPSVAEGGTILYTATVDAPVTGSPVVVNLANGQTITIAVGQSSGTTTGAVSNDVYQGHAPVTNSISNVSGGNYENLIADHTQVSTSVTDVQDTTTVSLSATPSVAEGGQIVYTATLTNAAQSPVTVTLSNGQTITIAANQTSGSVSVATHGDNPYLDAGQVSTRITDASGGNFENLAVNNTPAVTSVTDTVDTSTVSLTATPSVAEGGTIVYTATVTAPVTGSAVVVTLANGQTITIPVGQSSATATAAVSNDVYQGHAPVTNSINTVSGGNYESLVADKSQVSTTVTDVTDTTTVTLTATPSVTEGGIILYTATVGAPVTGSPVVVTLTNGQTITIPVGQSSGTATSTVSNDVYQGHAPVSNSISNVSGGDYENMVADKTAVSTSVTDVQDTTTVSLSATPSVAEGGQIVYTATLTNAAQSPVTVTLSNGQTITIAANQTSGSVNVATHGDNPYLDAGQVSARITNASGGNFENLAVNSTPAVTNVTDTVDTSTVSLAATPSVTEGGSIVYTATVTAPVTGTAVVVTLANGQSITIPVGQSSGTTTTAVSNDVYQGHEPVTNSITAVSGGNYENLVANTAIVSTTVTDVRDTTTVSLTATPSVVEGSTILYTATVGAPVTGSPIVVTLTNGQTITIPVGQSSGTATGAVSNDVYQGHAAVTNSISNVSGGNYENLVADKATVSTSVTDVQDTTTVSLSATPSVAEGGQIVYTATLTNAAQSPVTVTLSNGQTITIPVGQSSGTATAAVSNDVYQGHPAVANSISNVSGGNYEYLVADKTTVSTSVTDMTDTTTVTLTATPSVTEGGTILYTATVGAPVTGSPVVVTLTNGQSITIPVGQSTGTATSAVSNDVYQGHAPVTNSISNVSGGSYENLVADKSQVSTSVTDVTDTTTVTLTATPSVAEGGIILYTATVGAPVTGSPVVVSLANGQTITIPVGQSSGTTTGAVSNDVYQGHAAVTNSISNVSGGNYENLVADKTTVSTTVTDVQDTTTVSLSATPSVAEGGQIVYTATLTNAAQSPVTVTLSNGQTITIAANQTSGSISVATHGDNPYLDAGQVSARITNASGGNFENLAVNSTPAVTSVTDTVDTSTVSLTATPSVAEGGTIVYTATVTAPVTGSAVVVTLANGQTITIPVGQSSGTATAAVSNDVYQGHPAVSNSISNVSGGNYENLVADKTQVSTSVTDVTDTTTVTLTATPSVTEGGTIIYTATVGAPVTGSPVVVTLTNGQTIMIPVGQSSGTATGAVSNDVYQGHAPVTNSISNVSGGNYESLVADKTQVSTNVTDVTDTTTVTLTATPSVAEGGTILYTATVGAPVTGSPVVVTLTNGQSITIPVGQSSGAATAAVSNDLYQGHAAVTNSISNVSGGNYENLVADKSQVSTSVSDVTDTTTVTLTASPSVAEGGTILYTASVGAPVTGSPVVVTLTNGQSITIPVGQSSGTATGAVSNDVYQGHAAVTNSISNVSGGNYENLVADKTAVSTSVTDVQDTTTVSLSATPSVAEGGQIVYTATLTNAAQSPVTVTLSNGQTITIGANQTSGSINVASHGDNPYLDAGQVTAHITDASGGNFENLAVNSTPAVTNVTDSVDTSTVSLSATPSVAEGGTIVYTATVTAPVTGSAVVVTLANGQTITIPVGQSSGTTTAVVSNDVYQGHPAVSNSISNVSGGNYENLVADKTQVSTSVTDVTDTTTVTLTATPSVAEGGTILYTASVGAPVTGSPVVVTLTNGQTITIPVGQSSGTATGAVSNDVYQGHASVTNSISDVSGGSYENLVADKSQVSTTVTDVTDTTTVTLTATPSVAEGGTITYTASVGAPVTGSPVVVSLANGQSITIPVGQSSGTATGAVTNDVYQGHAAVSNSITSVSGGNFENLVADQAPVSTSVTDVQDTTTVSLSATPSVAEGGQIVYTATLTNAAQSPVTVTLSNGQTITIAANQTSGSISVATHGDNPYLDAGQVSARITNASGGNFENLAVNTAPAVTNVTDTVDTSTVSLTATPSVAEGGTIVYTATVTAPVTGSAVVVTLANGQTITIPVGQSSGTVTAAVSNDVYQGHPAVSNSISNVSGGNYENLVA
ncbi:retention module-containing protein, partial [Pseudomonas sp. R11(2017)]